MTGWLQSGGGSVFAVGPFVASAFVTFRFVRRDGAGPAMDLMAASLPDAQANSRTAQSAAAALRAGGASLTWPGRQARVIREIQGGEASDDALSSWGWEVRGHDDLSPD
jgi:hypothetical protein